MSHNFDKYQFPNMFDVQSQMTPHNFHINETIQHTFDQRNQHHLHSYLHQQSQDVRTEDQVRSDLNFSIEDLLSKISKATADFEQPPKFNLQTQKQQSLNSSFKISNLSTSTETNSNQQRSDHCIEKYEPFVQTHKKRQSEPQKDAFSNNDRFRTGMGQKYNTVNHGFGEFRIDQKHQHKQQHGSSWNSIMKSDAHIEFQPEVKSEQIAQWGRSSSRNQPSYTQFNTQSQQISQWGRNSSRNQPLNTFKEPQTFAEWGRSSSRNQPKIQPSPQTKYTEPTTEWGRNSSKNQPKVQPINQWVSSLSNNQTSNKPINQWKSSDYISEWGRNSSRNAVKTQVTTQWKTPQISNQWNKNSFKSQYNAEPVSEWKSTQKFPELGKNSSRNQPKLNQPMNFQNIHETEFTPYHQPQIIRSLPKKSISNPPQTQVKIEPTKKQLTKNQLVHKQNQQIPNSPKREIQALLNPFQNSGFGKSNNDMLKKPQKTRQIAASIIIQDEVQSNNQCQQIHIEKGKKVNSLFDVKKIRQVAASTIMDSPDKMKKNKNKSPFLEIVQASSDPIQQASAQQNIDSEHNIPMIRINKVQKSEIVQQIQGQKLTIQDFHLGRELGSGKFGDVYQAVHKATGALYAIKKIFKSTILQYNMIEQFTRQLKIHYTLNYPNIIKLFTHFDDEYHIFLVMEYGQGGMLMEKIKNGEKFASVIVQQMLRAVEYLHNKKIAHRDIKPENIVLMFGDTAKLCDFGWSRVFDSDMKKTFCGTLDYVSPQMKDKGQYSLKIDVWSLGVLTFELLCGYAPFKDEITNWKRKGGNLNKAWNWNILYPPEVSSVAQSFMRNLLKQNPNERANIRFCLNHLFVRKYNQMSFDEEEDKRFKQIANLLKEEN